MSEVNKVYDIRCEIIYIVYTIPNKKTQNLSRALFLCALCLPACSRQWKSASVSFVTYCELSGNFSRRAARSRSHYNQIIKKHKIICVRFEAIVSNFAVLCIEKKRPRLLNYVPIKHCTKLFLSFAVEQLLSSFEFDNRRRQSADYIRSVHSSFSDADLATLLLL